MDVYLNPNERKLDEKTLAKAKKELNENPKQREIDIESTKNWILKQNYMNSRLDDDFIISYLRAAKYSYAKTQDLIRNNWINRTEMADWFHDRNYDEDSVTMEIADIGIYFPLPKTDDEGKLVIVQRMGLLNVEKYDFNDLAKYVFSVLDIISQDPRIQINGVSQIFFEVKIFSKNITLGFDFDGYDRI